MFKHGKVGGMGGVEKRKSRIDVFEWIKEIDFLCMAWNLNLI